ncbi:alpha-hydroxy acid oxidase [Methyloversatilis discipulorum]|uniref:alpha-hydroxy acid oxidase n=1 Tax=Methyloversatilis discipulorum TaxID=1119528 RepID=UPI001E32A18C|nr:alpha-hydroxy acid oxidase [Methyloversatilis discipulorum]
MWHYLDGGRDTVCGRANRTALDAMPLWPRPLVDVRGGHTRIELFGESLGHPLLLAPIAYQRLQHPDGECASAMAAAAQDGQMVVSTLASQPLEQIARAAEKPLWFQLYWQSDRERTARLLDRALAAGYRCVVFTVDAPIKLAASPLPADVRAVNIEPPGQRQLRPGQSEVFDGWMADAPGWDDLVWLRARTPVPLLIKGVLHAADAARAVDLGCDGVVVSNHGGRVLDCAPPALSCLTEVIAAVGDRVPVLFDSGIDSGADALRALSLGARAVMVGRPYLWGLAAGGALGVAHVIRLLRDELEMCMALCGCATLADVSADRCG